MSIFRVSGCYRVSCPKGQGNGEVRFCMVVAAECETTAVQMAMKKLPTDGDCKQCAWELMNVEPESRCGDRLKALRIGRYLAFGFDGLD